MGCQGRRTAGLGLRRNNNASAQESAPIRRAEPRRRCSPARAVRAVVDIRPTPRRGDRPRDSARARNVSCNDAARAVNWCSRRSPVRSITPPAGPLDGDAAGQDRKWPCHPGGRSGRSGPPAHRHSARWIDMGEPAEVACVDGRRIRFWAIRVKNHAKSPLDRFRHGNTAARRGWHRRADRLMCQRSRRLWVVTRWHGGRHMVVKPCPFAGWFRPGWASIFGRPPVPRGHRIRPLGGAMSQSPGPRRAWVVIAAGAAIISPVTPHRSARTALLVPHLTGGSRG